MRPGAVWKRREPQGDPYDAVRTVGAGPTGGIVVTPVDGFASPIEADPTELGQQYELTIELDDSPIEAWETKLEELARRP